MAEVNILNNTVVSVGEALQLVSQFFDTEWPETREEDVELVQLTNGYSSSMHVIHRSTPAVNEPSSLILRQRKGYFSELNDIYLLTEAEQAIVFYECGKRGWGPKLYGITNGVRVEEFIPSRTLRPNDCADPDILKDLARSYARMHSLALPLCRRRMNVLDDLFQTIDSHKCNQEKIISTFRSAKTPDGDYLADNYFNVDFEKDVKRMLQLAYESSGSRVYFNHGDTNFLNVLVRDQECTGDMSRIVLVDIELGGYGNRGIDLGGHFVNRMFDWRGREHKMSGSPFPDEAERRRFCQLYLQSLSELECAATDVDTVDHLMEEVDMGASFFCLTMLIMTAKHLDFFILEPAFLTGFRVMLEFYNTRKSH